MEADTTVTPGTSTSADAIDPRLVVVRRDPLNCETPLNEQIGLITPSELFYIRTNFPIPRLDADAWRLNVDGEVAQPLELTYAQIRSLPSRSMIVTLECAGNGRSNLQPKADGEPWQYGAVGTAEWTGVPLGTVLAAAGLTDRARTVVISGSDGGNVAAVDHPINFARGMSVEQALAPEVMLAYAMNGAELPTAHGFPLRLVVPGWYGMASVKWVNRITVLDGEFEGYYQVQRYIMTHPERGETTVVPLTTIRVRSLITSPAAGSTVPRGQHRIRGFAWSGAAPIAAVEVSTDGGATWRAADLVSEPLRYAWRRWEYLWDAQSEGPAVLQSRAFDEKGNSQPVDPEWNRLGYANNAIQSVSIVVQE